MLTGGGLLAVLGCEHLKLEGAGPLAVIIAAFTSIYSWTQQGWHIEDVRLRSSIITCINTDLGALVSIRFR